jgi:hypothetical protein
VVAERVTDQVQVQPAGGWDDHQHIAHPARTASVLSTSAVSMPSARAASAAVEA